MANVTTPIGFNFRDIPSSTTDTPPDIRAPINNGQSDQGGTGIYDPANGYGWYTGNGGVWSYLAIWNEFYGIPRLQGGAAVNNVDGQAEFRVDVEPGVYRIGLGFYAPTGASTGARLKILDDTILRHQINPSFANNLQFSDANGAVSSKEDWAINNGTGYDENSSTVEVACASGILCVRYYHDDTGTGYRVALAHFRLSQVSAFNPPTITDEPDSVEVSQPATATFSVTLGGGAYSALRWQTRPDSGGTVTDVAGANATSYATGPTDLSMSGRQYRLAADWAGGTAYSAWATLTVNAGPAGVVSDVTGTATGGTTATVSFTPGTPAATSHTLELESPSGAGNWTAPASTLAGGVFSVTGLGGVTEYRPRVRASNAAGTSAWVVGAAFSTDNVGTGGAEIPGITMTPTVAIILLDEAGAPLQNVTGLRWTLYDKPPGDATAAVVARGTAGAANPTTGAFSVTATGRADGDLLWLDVTNSDGTLTQSPGPRSFSGPVAVEMV